LKIKFTKELTFLCKVINGKNIKETPEAVTGIMSKLYNRQGIVIMKANNIGNSTVQQKLISWSKRILGKLALTQMKVNINIELFNPKAKAYTKPSNSGIFTICISNSPHVIKTLFP
jgi:hypothetical protein